MRFKVIVSSAFWVIFLIGCGKTEEEKAAESEKYMERYRKEEAAEQAQVEKEFEGATDEQLRSLLYACQQSIMDMARRQYKPYEPFMVDSYSADALQAHTFASGGRIQKEGDLDSRVTQYRRQVKGGNSSPALLDSLFSVTVTQGAFGEPKRMNRNAICKWLPGLRFEAMWR